MEDFVYVVAVDDYHELEYMADSIKSGKKFKSHECGLGEDRKYWGIIYTGRRPSKSNIATRLDLAGFVPYDYD